MILPPERVNLDCSRIWPQGYSALLARLVAAAIVIPQMDIDEYAAMHALFVAWPCLIGFFFYLAELTRITRPKFAAIIKVTAKVQLIGLLLFSVAFLLVHQM